MRAWILCLALAGCGVSGFRVAKKDGAPVLPPTSSVELVDAPPSGAQELGRVEVIGAEGDACKAEAKERAKTLGATHVVVAPHPEPFKWQNTQKETLAAPRCVGTAYAAAPGAAAPTPPSSSAPEPPAAAPPAPPPPAT